MGTIWRLSYFSQPFWSCSYYPRMASDHKNMTWNYIIVTSNKIQPKNIVTGLKVTGGYCAMLSITLQYSKGGRVWSQRITEAMHEWQCRLFFHSRDYLSVKLSPFMEHSAKTNNCVVCMHGYLLRLVKNKSGYYSVSVHNLCEVLSSCFLLVEKC